MIGLLLTGLALAGPSEGFDESVVRAIQEDLGVTLSRKQITCMSREVQARMDPNGPPLTDDQEKTLGLEALSACGMQDDVFEAAFRETLPASVPEVSFSRGQVRCIARAAVANLEPGTLPGEDEAVWLAMSSFVSCGLLGTVFTQLVPGLEVSRRQFACMGDFLAPWTASMDSENTPFLIIQAFSSCGGLGAFLAAADASSTGNDAHRECMQERVDGDRALSELLARQVPLPEALRAELDPIVESHHGACTGGAKP